MLLIPNLKKYRKRLGKITANRPVKGAVLFYALNLPRIA